MEGEKDSEKSSGIGIGTLKDGVLIINTVGLGVLGGLFASTSRRFDAELQQLRDENAALNERLLEIETQEISKKNIDTALKSMSMDIARQSARLSTLEAKVREKSIASSTKPKPKSRRDKHKAKSSSSEDEPAPVPVIEVKPKRIPSSKIKEKPKPQQQKRRQKPVPEPVQQSSSSSTSSSSASSSSEDNEQAGEGKKKHEEKLASDDNIFDDMD